jgi:hypothetical protein
MTEKTKSNSKIALWWMISVVAIAYSFGELISGGVITAAKLPWPTLPGSVEQSTNLLMSFVGAFFIAGCMALLARGVGGSFVSRWLILAVFTYVTFGFNNQLEAAFFTAFGGTTTMMLFFITPCVLGAAAAAKVIRQDPASSKLETVVSEQPVSSWWWRVVVAWLAFPVIYLFFGTLVAPIVVPYYQQLNFGLTLPGFDTIIPLALGRSALFLLVTIPVLVNWTGSRRSLFWTLSISFFAMMGLVGLLTTFFFPPALRVFHSIEILADAVVYAWVLVALFIPKPRVAVKSPVAVAAECTERRTNTRGKEVAPMKTSIGMERQLSFVWKIPVIAVIYTIGKTIGWTLVTKAGMPFHEIPGHTYNHLLGFLSALVLAACIYLLAKEIGGLRSTRWLILVSFTYVSFVINNQIEGLAFTTTAEVPTMLLFFILPCAAATGAAAFLIRPSEGGSPLPTIFSEKPTSTWWWRLVIAWLAFPVIYYFFGAMIYPMVADVYAEPDSGLRVPSQVVVLGAVTIRSLLFLAATIPIIVKWQRSRRALVLSLAAAFTVMVGVAGLIESTWMPPALRIVHSLEIAADSLVHAWILVALLVPKPRRVTDEPEPVTAI